MKDKFTLGYVVGLIITGIVCIVVIDIQFDRLEEPIMQKTHIAPVVAPAPRFPDVPKWVTEVEKEHAAYEIRLDDLEARVKELEK